MSDLALNPATGDLDLSVGLTPRLVDGLEAIAQQLRIRLRFFQGEWFLDLRQGVPYFQLIFSGKMRKNLVDTIFKDAILTTPGVNTITEFLAVFDGRTRAYTLTFRVDTVAGLLDFSQPFLINSAEL